MSPESRMREIRPFGSMRGGRVLVIGGNAFQPSLSCLLYFTSNRAMLGVPDGRARLSERAAPAKPRVASPATNPSTRRTQRSPLSVF